jgi:hypothetical protein
VFRLRLAIGVLLLLAAGCQRTAAPSASAGVIDLRSADLGDQPLALKGDWELYWNRAPDGKPDALIPGAAKWRGTRITDGSVLGAYGRATYRLKVELPEALKGARLAIATDSSDCAQRLSAATVGGEPLFTPVSAGVVGDQGTHKPAYRHLTAWFVPRDDFYISLEVSNFDTRGGGPWMPPQLGRADVIDQKLRNDRDRDYFLIGVLFMMALLHLGIYVLRRREQGPLWLFLFSMLVVVRTMVTGRQISEEHAERWFSLLNNIEYLTFYAAVPLFCLFVRAVFPNYFSRFFARSVMVSSGPFVLLAVFAPPRVLTESLMPFQAITFFYITLLMVVMGRAIWRERDTMALLFLLGFTVLAVTVTNDILRTQELVQTPYVVAYGLTGFLVFQSLVIALMNQRARQQAEGQARDLATLNDELRRQVGDRGHRLSEMLTTLALDMRKATELKPGALIAGRYRVERLLGEGGMGAVYAATRTSDDKDVALKVIRMTAAPQVLARFAREAEAAATVNHPNVVSILDLDAGEAGQLFIVMERVRGQTLDLLRKRFGDATWALPILAQLAGALAAIHRSGVVHRDLKPSNIMLDQAGVLKVADFGIAALRRSEGPDPGDSLEATRNERPGGVSELTQTGVIMGSPFYMAPEAAKGAQHVTTASDMFSFGLIAYELLCGHRPFPAPIVQNVTSDPPPPLGKRCTNVAPALIDLVEQCLRFDPSARPDAQTLVTRLG